MLEQGLHLMSRSKNGPILGGVARPNSDSRAIRHNRNLAVSVAMPDQQPLISTILHLGTRFTQRAPETVSSKMMRQNGLDGSMRAERYEHLIFGSLTVMR